MTTIKDRLKEKYREEKFIGMAQDAEVPSHDIDSLYQYLTQGIEPGGFLVAVLENNLFEAMGRADLINRKEIFKIVSFIYQCFPSASWGSVQKVRDWMAIFKKEDN